MLPLRAQGLGFVIDAGSLECGVADCSGPRAVLCDLALEARWYYSRAERSLPRSYFALTRAAIAILTA